MKKLDEAKETNFIQYLRIIQNNVLKVNEKNISESVELINKLIDSNYSYSSMIVISRLIYSYFMSHKSFKVYLQFLKIFSTKYSDTIIDTFTQLLIHLNSQETNYLLEKLIEENLINAKIVSNMKSLYFIHYKTNEEINALKDLTSDNPFHKKFFEHIEELRKDDWKLHKQFIREGTNPSNIVTIIRNDEIEKLQEISTEPKFDFKQIIEPSLYERYSFINKENVSLVDYAAFFGSIKCFKFLVLNNVDIKNTGIYAVAGGNLEIVYICEQNHSNFEGSIEIAIEYHRNEIFQYFFDNENIKEEDLTELAKKCIIYNNYEILSFLTEKKLNFKELIIESVESGNIFLFKHFSNGNEIPKEALMSAARSGNKEIVKLLLDKGKFDVNIKYVSLYLVKNILIIWSFKICNKIYFDNFIHH